MAAHDSKRSRFVPAHAVAAPAIHRRATASGLVIVFCAPSSKNITANFDSIRLTGRDNLILDDCTDYGLLRKSNM
jgi:hypothetical protein